MPSLQSIFSTREIALATWVVIILLPFLLGKNFRESIGSLLDTFFSKQIIRPVILLLAYVILSLILLYRFGLWDISLVKDSVLWFFTVALATFFSINKAKDTGYFTGITRDNFKWLILFEFVVNFYTFNLWIEMILIPFIIFVSVMSAFSGLKKEHQRVHKLMNNILTLFGLVIFLYVLYETVIEYQKTFTLQNLKALLHPVIMTALFLPFAYLLALFVNYESLFVRVNFLANQGISPKRVKRRILIHANLNINRLMVISRDLHGFVQAQGFNYQ